VRHNSRSRSTISKEGKNGSFKKEIAFNRTKFVPDGGSIHNSREDINGSLKGSVTNSKQKILKSSSAVPKFKIDLSKEVVKRDSLVD